MLTSLLLASILLVPSSPARADSTPSQPITLTTPTGDLFGSLVVPRGSGAHPIVLIIAGSGPTDRDGNSPVPVAPGKPLRTDAYKLLADALASEGIASVRYDKRGVAASASAMAGRSESDLRFDTGVDDAAAWITMLRADPRFSRIVVVGHSEGSLVGMLAAQRARADGFISLEGTGRRAPDVLREQLLASGVPSTTFEPTLDSLSAGKLVKDPPPTLASLFRASVQPYLISWFRYDPAVEMKKLPYATLVIQGTHDIQVTAKDASLLAGNPRASLLTVDGMTHVLKMGPPDAGAQMTSVYSDPAIPLAPEVAAAIVAYVRDAHAAQ